MLIQKPDLRVVSEGATIEIYNNGWENSWDLEVNRGGEDNQYIDGLTIGHLRAIHSTLGNLLQDLEVTKNQ